MNRFKYHNKELLHYMRLRTIKKSFTIKIVKMVNQNLSIGRVITVPNNRYNSPKLIRF